MYECTYARQTYLYFFFCEPIFIFSQFMEINTLGVIAWHPADKIITIFGGAKRRSNLMTVKPKPLQRLNRSPSIVFEGEGYVGTHSRMRRSMVAMNDYFGNAAVLSELFRATKNLFRSDGTRNSNNIHQITLHNTIIVQMLSINRLNLSRHRFVSCLLILPFFLLLFLIFLHNSINAQATAT
jgi:hypothetical protein